MDSPVVPFRQFVLKVHSRCDLACDHCYVYEHADTSWRGRPRAVSDEVLVRTAERIAEHVSAHALASVHVVFHGGEPLLAGPARLRRATEELRGALPETCSLDLRIHTNGVLLDERFCDLFDELDIKVGVSLDGDRAANDRHRRFADGRSSHPQVLRAVALLDRPRFRRLYAGLLCTIDVENDPLAVYDALVALDPPRIDFLLPHATWDEPPPRPPGSETPYADWLGAIFERWTAQGRPVPVRLFDSVLRTLRGQSSLTESLGLDPADLVVIETDGALEQADSLKTAYNGAPATGFDVFADSLDDAARHPGVRDRQRGLEGLCAQCRGCPVVRSCGGGLYAHRYRTGSGFANPSTFCGDLMKLITGIRDHAPATVAATGVTPPPPEPEAGGLTDAHLDELASGFGGADAVAALAGTQLRFNRELLASVWTLPGPGDRATAAWELLTDLDTTAPDAVDTVVGHPYTRVWAVRCLDDRPEAARPPGADSVGIAEIAAAAMVLAGRTDTLTVPVRDGAVHLPGLGRVLVGGAATAAVTGTNDGFTVRADGHASRIHLKATPAEGWEPVHRPNVPGWAIAIDDTDRHRATYGSPPTDRLTGADAGAWDRSLAEAWRIIARDLPDYAPGVAAGLRTITPLRPAGGTADISATSRDAFGAVGIARPLEAGSLALLVVHEFQHVKLGALLDMFDLYDPADTRLYYAPWRDDPRPLEGLLQGTYAHLAVTDYWRVRRRTMTGPAADEAEVRFAHWRRQTREAVDRLAGSGALTRLGARFVAGMLTTVDTWRNEPVTAAALTAAHNSARDHRATWQARPVLGNR